MIVLNCGQYKIHFVYCELNQPGSAIFKRSRESSQPENIFRLLNFDLFQKLESGLSKRATSPFVFGVLSRHRACMRLRKNSLDYSEVDAIRYSTEKELLNC